MPLVFLCFYAIFHFSLKEYSDADDFIGWHLVGAADRADAGRRGGVARGAGRRDGGGGAGDSDIVGQAPWQQAAAGASQGQSVHHQQQEPVHYFAFYTPQNFRIMINF